MSTSRKKRRDKGHKGKNQANARKKNKGGGIPPPIEAGLRGTNPSSRCESTRTASGEQSKGLANDRNTNVETESDALTTIVQSQTQPDRWKDRNISQPDIPIPVIDRPNWNQQSYHTSEITIKTTKIISGSPDSKPDDGKTLSVWHGMRIQYWLGLILLGITLMGAVVSKDARAALMKLVDTVAEVITALNKFKR